MLAAKSFNATSSPAELDRWMGILAEELAHRLTEDGIAHSRAPRGLTLSYRCFFPLSFSQLHEGCSLSRSEQWATRVTMQPGSADVTDDGIGLLQQPAPLSSDCQLLVLPQYGLLDSEKMQRMLRASLNTMWSRHAGRHLQSQSKGYVCPWNGIALCFE